MVEKANWMCDKEFKLQDQKPTVPAAHTIETTKATTEEEEKPMGKPVLVNTWVEQQQ